MTRPARRLALAAPLVAVLVALAALLLATSDTPPEGPAAPPAAGHKVAIFAGGCFWCMEPPFDSLPGVISTTSGYTGGSLANPSYEQVSSGGTGHRESVRVEYDPEQVGYPALLEVFWHNVDPTDSGGQFCDRGEQYTTAIFATSETQRKLAEASKQELEHSGQLEKPVVTPVLDASDFYPAEKYHQDYYKKNPVRYKFYRAGCGRDRVLERLWGQSGGH